jgi:AraC-like DNA-binding protein
MSPKQGIEYWNDVACNTFTAQSIDPLDDRFHAAMYRANLGDLRMALAVSTSAVVTRTRHQVARSPEAYYLLHLQLGGCSVNRQDGREIELTKGDFAMFDSTRPYRIEFRQDTSILVLRAPQSLFRRSIPSPEALTLLPMSGRSGAGHIASRVIQEVWTGLQEGLPVESADDLCRAVMDLVAGAYAAVPRLRTKSPSTAGTLRAQICRFIEERLGEQDLSIASIAAAFGITSRYVHTVFEADRDTVSEYIQTRRLQESAKSLAHPVRSTATIGEIAVAHGFKSQAHFARVFRKRYGLTPRDFRRGSQVSLT